MSKSPVVVFTYNRLLHTQRTIEALQKNDLASESDLILFSDGPRSGDDQQKVSSVRGYLRTVNGFRNVSIIGRQRNLGLAQSIIRGVSEIINKFGRIIVLEDDMVSSRYFLKYMNEALDFYEDSEQVVSVHGYVYPIVAELPETFFLRGADCWGWGTWKRGWDLFDPDGKKLLAGIRNRGLEKEFDFNGAYSYLRMLEDQISGKNDSWAVRWYASAYLRDLLTLYPGRSLIRNIGADESGTHSGTTRIYDTEVSREPIKLADIPIRENRKARKEFERYLKTVRPGIADRVVNKVSRFFR